MTKSSESKTANYKETSNGSQVSRRKAVKKIVGGLTAFAAYNALPAKWSTPRIESVFIPAHAQTSGAMVGTPLFCTHDLTIEFKSGNEDIIWTTQVMYSDDWRELQQINTGEWQRTTTIELKEINCLAPLTIHVTSLNKTLSPFLFSGLRIRYDKDYVYYRDKEGNTESFYLESKL